MAADHRIISAMAPRGKGRILSVLVGRTYEIDPSGGASLLSGAFALQQEPEDYEGIEQTGKIRPAILRRDVDLYAWRDFTDLVIQGTARLDRELRSTMVELRCKGDQVNTSLTLAVSGDRRIERGPRGLRLSEAEFFSEMPLRYDKAFGGTDELAEEKFADPEFEELFREALGDEIMTQTGDYSYPRNPAGKGFVVEPESLEGLAFPNLEFADQRLPTSDLEALARPMEEWGERPLPACFDWLSYGYFPRLAFFGPIPSTHDGQVPSAEVKLGILRPDEARYPLEERVHRFAQGAHPYLCRNRFRGGEQISVSALGHEGRTLELTLPTHRPQIHVCTLAGTEEEATVSLDLVFLEADARRLTLLFRGTVPARKEHLPIEWQSRCPYRIQWT